MFPSALFKTAGRIWNAMQQRRGAGKCHSVGDGTLLVIFAYDVDVGNA